MNSHQLLKWDWPNFDLFGGSYAFTNTKKRDYINGQWEFQDPKMEVLYYIRPYFGGISPYIGLKNRPYIWNRYLHFRILKFPLISFLLYNCYISIAICTAKNYQAFIVVTKKQTYMGWVKTLGTVSLPSAHPKIAGLEWMFIHLNMVNVLHRFDLPQVPHVY